MSKHFHICILFFAISSFAIIEEITLAPSPDTTRRLNGYFIFPQKKSSGPIMPFLKTNAYRLVKLLFIYQTKQSLYILKKLQIFQRITHIGFGRLELMFQFEVGAARYVLFQISDFLYTNQF